MIDLLVVLACLAVIGGVILLAYKILSSLSDRFGWAAEPEPVANVAIADSHPEPLPEPEPVEINRAGVGLAIAGAVLMVVGCFLPGVESTTFSQIVDNTLIASGNGIFVIAIAVGAVAGTYRLYQQGRQDWSVFIDGLFGIAAAVYAGTGDRLELQSLDTSLATVTVTGSPGVGIWVVGVGAGLVTCGGLFLAGHGAWFGGQMSARQVKTCPDCAETVLADAHVCKHCGHRFSAPATTL